MKTSWHFWRSNINKETRYLRRNIYFCNKLRQRLIQSLFKITYRPIHCIGNIFRCLISVTLNFIDTFAGWILKMWHFKHFFKESFFLKTSINMVTFRVVTSHICKAYALGWSNISVFTNLPPCLDLIIIQSLIFLSLLITI